MSTTKKAVVLGGSRGIGAAVVRHLREQGYEVSFTYANSESTAQALADKTGAVASQVDSADGEAVRAFVEGQGALDAVIVSAGALVMGPATDLDSDAVDHMIDVNVRGPYHALVSAAKSMNTDGRMVVIGSVNGDRMPFAGGSAYAMTKSAMQGMVRGLAREFGDRGITVNAVQPGPVDTEMNPADGPMASTMHGFMAIQRHVSADEVASMVDYLVSPQAAMVTGSLQTIDGGFGA